MQRDPSLHGYQIAQKWLFASFCTHLGPQMFLRQQVLCFACLLGPWRIPHPVLCEFGEIEHVDQAVEVDVSLLGPGVR